MIKFYKCKRFLAIEIQGHFKQDICNTISIITQFSQWVLPKMFVNFSKGYTFILAKNKKEKNLINKVILFFCDYFSQNNIKYEYIKNKKIYLKLNRTKLKFIPIED